MERYIITSFGYGCNLGPTQTSKHMRNTVTPHMLSFVNRRHINAQKIDEAIRDILNQYNQYNQFSLPNYGGVEKRRQQTELNMIFMKKTYCPNIIYVMVVMVALLIIKFQIPTLRSLATSSPVVYGKPFILLMDY